MRKYLRYIITFTVIILLILTWYSLNWSGNREERQKEYLSSPEVKLSVLPPDMQESLSELEERARKKHEDMNDSLISIFGVRKITEDTPLILQTYYRESEEIAERITELPASFAGLTRQQLSSLLQEWSIREFRPGKALVLYRTKQGLSPDDRNNHHLGLKDGRVVIFYGSEGRDKIRKITDIRAGDIPSAERKRLERGVKVNSREELLAVLEGLRSYKND